MLVIIRLQGIKNTRYTAMDAHKTVELPIAPFPGLVLFFNGDFLGITWEAHVTRVLCNADTGRVTACCTLDNSIWGVTDGFYHVELFDGMNNRQQLIRCDEENCGNDTCSLHYDPASLADYLKRTGWTVRARVESGDFAHL